MAAISVTTTAALIAEPWTDFQNLGSVAVYLDNVDTVSSSTGIRIDPGGIYTRPAGWKSGSMGSRPKPVYAKAASGIQDCRTIA